MKRLLYILCWIILGIILSFIAHGLIETAYIKYLLDRGIVPVNTTFFIGHAYCALPVLVQIILLFSGIAGGFFAGKYFWKVVYVDRRK